MGYFLREKKSQIGGKGGEGQGGEEEENRISKSITIYKSIN